MSGFTHEQGQATVEWYTPPELFTALDLRFDLDPCAPPLPAAKWIPTMTRYVRGGPDSDGGRRLGAPMEQIGADGLTTGWFGRVWLNPPYGAETAKWVGKLVDHHRAGWSGVALTFARVDTPWWQAAAARASLVCFIAGRLEYVPGDIAFQRRSRAGAPSSLMAFGEECAEALAQSQLGMCFVPEMLESMALPLTGLHDQA